MRACCPGLSLIDHRLGNLHVNQHGSAKIEHLENKLALADSGPFLDEWPAADERAGGIVRVDDHSTDRSDESCS